MKVFVYGLPLELLASGSMGFFPMIIWNRNLENEESEFSLTQIFAALSASNRIFNHLEILNENSSTGESWHEKLENLL